MKEPDFQPPAWHQHTTHKITEWIESHYDKTFHCFKSHCENFSLSLFLKYIKPVTLWQLLFACFTDPWLGGYCSWCHGWQPTKISSPYQHNFQNFQAWFNFFLLKRNVMSTFFHAITFKHITVCVTFSERKEAELTFLRFLPKTIFLFVQITLSLSVVLYTSPCQAMQCNAYVLFCSTIPVHS